MRTIWAFRRLEKLQGQTGFVEVDDALADELIAAGDAQDPQLGATALNEIEAAPPAPPPNPARDDDGGNDDDEPGADEYETKVVTPKKPATRRRR